MSTDFKQIIHQIVFKRWHLNRGFLPTNLLHCVLQLWSSCNNVARGFNMHRCLWYWLVSVCDFLHWLRIVPHFLSPIKHRMCDVLPIDCKRKNSFEISKSQAKKTNSSYNEKWSFSPVFTLLWQYSWFHNNKRISLLLRPPKNRTNFILLNRTFT